MDSNLAFLIRGIPTLSTMNFHQWLTGLIEAARFLDCHRNLLGYEPEPYRDHVKPGNPRYNVIYPPGTRAGDGPPALNQRPETPFTELLGNSFCPDMLRTWKDWAVQEGKAQYLLLHTIGPFHREAVQDLWSAHHMVAHLTTYFTQRIKGPAVNEGPAMASLRLPESPTTEQMRDHMAEFQLQLQQSMDGEVDEHESGQMMCQTLIFTVSQPLAAHLEMIRSRHSGDRVAWRHVKNEYLAIAEDPRPLSKPSVPFSA